MDKEYKERVLNVLKEIDSFAPMLVGILCKRIEVLDKHKVLKPNVYKDFLKEELYEQFRNFKKLIELHLTIGIVKFEDPKAQK